MQAHRMLVATHTETIEANTPKWRHSTIAPRPSSAVPSPAVPSPVLQSIPLPSQLNRAMYPKVWFWTKQEWRDFEASRKDSSDLVVTSSVRGAIRAAMGKNVWVQYVKHADGKMVDGGMATEIRDQARKIWRGLWSQGLAPRTWGAATHEVEDAFIHSMEERFPVLQFCDNHWKAQAIATANYSQWYKYHKAKMEASEAEANHKHIKDDLDDESCIEPVTKKSKATIQVNALDTADLGIEGGQAEDPKIAVKVIDDVQPSQ
jgi:hypothetical protein